MLTTDIVWDERLVSNWERNAIALPARTAIIPKAEVFKYLCNLGSEWQGNHKSPRVHFATEHGEMEVHRNIFPKRSDRSFENYYSRVSGEYDACSTLLYVRNVQTQSDCLTKEIDRILAPLWVSGVRWSRLEVELYVGRYDWTAIGIHREPCGNIHQVILGEKEIIVWPPHVLSAQHDRPECAIRGASADEALEAGLLGKEECASFKARACEAIYFPSGHWHVGVSKRLSVSLDLSLYGTKCPTWA